MDDALHLFFECDGAGLAAARARHQPLLSQLPPFATQPAALALALANTTQHSMALFVADCTSCLPKPPSHRTRRTVRGAAARTARTRSASTGSDEPRATESYSEYSELVDDFY
jgi:hypothetical protein